MNTNLLPKIRLFCIILGIGILFSYVVCSNDAADVHPIDAVRTLAQEIQNKGWIAYSEETERGDWDMFMMRPDGSDKQNITNTPEYNEAGVRFSPDGTKMLYYRMPKSIPLDNNTYGNQVLMMANANGTNAETFGDIYHWAAWGSDSTQLVCLDAKGIHIINIKKKQVIRTLPRKGFVQQIGWSPDGQWFCGTANGLGAYWSIGRMNAQSGNINVVSETDRFNCTPDWFHDSDHIIYSRGINPEEGGWAELWMANGDGSGKKLLYAEKQRHIYGGALSPDDRYLLFTRSEADLGTVKNSQINVAIIRFSDAPMKVGQMESHLTPYLHDSNKPILDLGRGWEPVWTYKDVMKN